MLSLPAKEYLLSYSSEISLWLITVYQKSFKSRSRNISTQHNW